MWDKVRQWFKDSETIFLARLTAFVGFAIGVVGVMDWSPLLGLMGTSTDFNWRQLMGLGVAMVIQGVLLEAARRNRATDL